MESRTCDKIQAIHAQVTDREAFALKCLQSCISYLLTVGDIEESQRAVFYICDNSQGLVIYSVIATTGLKLLECRAVVLKEFQHSSLGNHRGV